MLNLIPLTRLGLWFLLLALAGLTLSACGRTATEAVEQPAPAGPYTLGKASRDGIGKFYLGREISHVMGHQGAGWLERAGREREERTDLLIQSLPLQPDSVVADIGAGTGYFSFPIAAAGAGRQGAGGGYPAGDAGHHQQPSAARGPG